MMKYLLLIVTFCLGLSTLQLLAQGVQIQRVDPVNWWVGMKNPKLQLLVYGKNIAECQVSLNHPGVTLDKVNKVANPNYLFLDLTISPRAQVGKMRIDFSQDRTVLKKKKKPEIIKETNYIEYELLARNNQPKGQGVNQSDFIYLIMPDRFANGDPTNDKFSTMLDTTCNPKSPFLRHGGDFQGIINHLDYLKDLGVSALWMTPVIENDESLKKELHGNLQAGYHGYHFTDHYKIDRRFGGIEGYKKLSDVLHQNGMKLIQDAVYNHVSDDYWMWKDQPTPTWFNKWDTYTNTSHKEASLMAPNSAQIDNKIMIEGWFTPFLPDLNLRDPYCANYLIQHALWSTELFNVDGWRIDTYKYNDMEFMNRCNAALIEQYPHIMIYGESWINTPAQLAYFVKNKIDFPIKCNQPGTCDFPLYSAINAALNEPFGWDGGVNRIYQVLAQDFVYENPNNMVTFLENHDTDRYFSVIGENMDNYKMGITWLFTTRGIPHFYYGTEILMKNFKNPTDAEVRQDFPGGWKGDAANKFVSTGRSQAENDAFNFVKKLAHYRRNTSTLQTGKLTQFIPEDGTYVFARKDQHKTILVLSNTNSSAKTLDGKRFAEITNGFGGATEVLTETKISTLQSFTIPAKTAFVLELTK
ncbi:MAG: glycoside hydrolase family 13 protein [Spirosomataceae bacterium]